MEEDLIHIMKTHGKEASYIFLSQSKLSVETIERGRFVHLVQCHILNGHHVPHFEAVLQKMSQLQPSDDRRPLRF